VVHVLKGRPTQRAPDWWVRAAFSGRFRGLGRFRQSSVLSSRPPAGNANRWVGQLSESTRQLGFECFRGFHLCEVIGRKMLYVKSILAGILAGIVFLLVSAVLTTIIIVSQVRQRTPGIEVGVDIRSVMGLPLLGIIALLGFGIGFYWEYRRGSR
jgi:hypothetical protein